MSTLRELHSLHSSLRENIIEHRFICDALHFLWQRKIVDVEILKSEFDAGGYDLVLSRGSIVRHIQMKAVLTDGKTASVNINLNLAAKPSGCIIWVEVTEGLEIKGYRWFGAERPGMPLPDLSGFRISKHTKGTAKGLKNQRANLRVVPKRHFSKSVSLPDIIERLIGPLS